MKAIIISDLHTKFTALSALPKGYDELWVIGDLVNYGPRPQEIVDFVQKNATFAVRGNHDHAVGFNADPHCTPRYAPMASTTQAFSATELSTEDKRYLADLPLSQEFERDDKKPPNPLYGYCPADSDNWLKEVRKISADVLIVGHTHTPFIRQVGQTLVVNPGSFGQPKTGRSDACYAVWHDGRVELKEFAYPVFRTVKLIEAVPWPEDIRRDLVTVLQTGSVS